jgi:bifunctional polynucleotide phosphatase/kinase
MKWNNTQEYLYGETNKFKFKNKIASFDLDNTLIVTKSGKTFPIDENDWKFRFNNIKTKLHELKDSCIIIISNQAGISTKKEDPERWMKKIENISKELKIEMCVFCSTGHNIYRKPYPSFFTKIFVHDIDFENSFFCGDSAGRQYDYRDTDYKFALNCKLPFKTPELFFENKTCVIPKIIYPNTKEIKNKKIKFVPNQKEMIIMVGYPASGKSYISKYIHENFNYEIINQDELKTKAKCIKMATKLLLINKSLIIDSTNPDKKSRKEWIDLAKKYNYNIRLIKITTSLELSKHNNLYRFLKNEQKIIPDIVYRIFTSKYENPDISEGINEIITMNQVGKPNDELYNMFFY